MCIRDSLKVIEKYNKQKTLIDWGKKVGGLALDPKRKVTVVDVASSKQVTTYSRHNGRSRKTGTRTIDTSTYKDIFATELPKGDRWDLLETKLGQQADIKKERYLNLYKPLGGNNAKDLTDATVALKNQVTFETKVRKGVQNKYQGRSQIGEVKFLANRERLAEQEQKTKELEQKKKQAETNIEFTRYSYYGLDDKELSESEEYKRKLITGITNTDKVSDEIKVAIKEKPDVTKSKEQYEKMLLSELESEYDAERKDYESAKSRESQFITQLKEQQRAMEIEEQRKADKEAELQHRKATAFGVSSAIVRPNRRIVKLANQQSIKPQNIKNTETKNFVPSPRQRGGGFKRFSKW